MMMLIVMTMFRRAAMTPLWKRRRWTPGCPSKMIWPPEDIFDKRPQSAQFDLLIDNTCRELIVLPLGPYSRRQSQFWATTSSLQWEGSFISLVIISANLIGVHCSSSSSWWSWPSSSWPSWSTSDCSLNILLNFINVRFPSFSSSSWSSSWPSSSSWS